MADDDDVDDGRLILVDVFARHRVNLLGAVKKGVSERLFTVSLY